MALLVFDIETSNLFDAKPGEDIEKYGPFDVAVAVTRLDGENPIIWLSRGPSNDPLLSMREEDARRLLAYLDAMQQRGHTLCAWNGLKFDLRWIGHAAGDIPAASRVALGIYDPLFQLFKAKGFPVSLEAAAEGMSVSAQKTMDAADVPRYWRAGHFNAVCEYAINDVQMTMEVASRIIERREIAWITRRGERSVVPVPGLRSVADCLNDPMPDQSWMDKPVTQRSFTRWMSPSVARARGPRRARGARTPAKLRNNNPAANTSLALGILALLFVLVFGFNALAFWVGLLGVLLGGTSAALSIGSHDRGFLRTACGMACSIVAILVVIYAAITTALAGGQAVSEPSESRSVVRLGTADAGRGAVAHDDRPRQETSDSPPEEVLDREIPAVIPPMKPRVDAPSPRREVPSAPTPQWYSLGQTAIEVKHAEIGPVRMTGSEQEDERAFAIGLVITNKDRSNKVKYISWRGPSFTRRPAVLRDDRANLIRRLPPTVSRHPVGAVEVAESLAPGDSISDVLLFEVPSGDPDYYLLELPGEHVGARGESTTIRIPAELIRRN